MIDKLKNYIFFLVIGFVIIACSKFLDSHFLSEYLKKNLITLLIALLAINTTTCSVIMTKLKEISDKTIGDFSNTVSELKYSIFEQITLIIVAVIILILSESPKIQKTYLYFNIIFDGLLASVFVASLHSLYDTASSIFAILNYETKK